jgi:hypothetical protein
VSFRVIPWPTPRAIPKNLRVLRVFVLTPRAPILLSSLSVNFRVIPWPTPRAIPKKPSCPSRLRVNPPCHSVAQGARQNPCHLCFSAQLRQKLRRRLAIEG